MRILTSDYSQRNVPKKITIKRFDKKKGKGKKNPEDNVSLRFPNVSLKT